MSFQFAANGGFILGEEASEPSPPSLEFTFAPEGGFTHSFEAAPVVSTTTSTEAGWQTATHAKKKADKTLYVPTKAAETAAKTLNCCSYAPTKAAPAAKKVAKCSVCTKKISTSYEGKNPTCRTCLKAAKHAKATNDDDTASVVSSVSSTTSFMTNSSATTSASSQTISTGTASGGGRSGGQRRRRTTYDLVVRNVYSDELALETIFGRYGEVVDVRKVVPKANKPKGKTAKGALETRAADRKSTLPLMFVSFAEEQSADEAREALTGFRLHGTVWEVEWAKKGKGQK